MSLAPPVDASLRDAVSRPFWTDRDDAPTFDPPLEGAHEADTVVIGGGFTGLWAAWKALERRPDSRVIVLEAERVGFGASGRNGGFVSASLTHGLGHGLSMWPKEITELHQEGQRTLAGLIDDVAAAGIDCDLHEVGKTSLAVEPWQIDGLKSSADLSLRFGEEVEFQTRDEVQADVHSPTYLAGLRQRRGNALVDPARLAWGMARTIRERGGLVHEGSYVRSLKSAGAGVRVEVGTPEREFGTVRAREVVIATAAYPSPLRRLGYYLMPLYDHVLMTEPLSDEQLASIGWSERQGLTDAGNQFHYYRLTADNRILWGGWDAVYHRGSRVDDSLWNDSPSHALLANHFFATFPQLAGTRFTHKWAGPIDSTTRFTAAYGTAMGGRVAYAVGHTGLGVGAARFSAEVALDLLDGTPTERTGYGIVRRKPFPIPGEPIRDPLVQFMRRQMVAADQNEGRRSVVLRVLDRFGIGFNS